MAMRETQRNNDPYAPPPRHRDRSGALVRVGILAALLAGGAWGYVSFRNTQQTASPAPASEEQTFADAHGAGYRMETPATDSTRSPTSAAAPSPARVAPMPADPASPSGTEPSGAPAPLPEIESPSGD